LSHYVAFRGAPAHRIYVAFRDNAHAGTWQSPYIQRRRFGAAIASSKYGVSFSRHVKLSKAGDGSPAVFVESAYNARERGKAQRYGLSHVRLPTNHSHKTSKPGASSHMLECGILADARRRGFRRPDLSKRRAAGFDRRGGDVYNFAQIRLSLIALWQTDCSVCSPLASRSEMVRK